MYFMNIAASVNGLLSVTNAANDTLTVASLTDDLGTVNGITTTGSNAITLKQLWHSVTLL